MPPPAAPSLTTRSRPTTEPRHATGVDIAIIGTGFAGIGMGSALVRAGRDDFVILEKASDIGGTWRENGYPGCTCDVPSYLYSFSFRQNPNWSRLFAAADEIWDYLRGCVDAYGLKERIRLDCEVVEAAYDESRGRWRVALADGSAIDCRILISGMGALHEPKIPQIDGLDSFAGTMFHSARWRHDEDLSGRRVAVIGTGASAIQFVPAIAPQVARLDLYQRTPAWITPKPNPRIRPDRQATYTRRPSRQRAIRDTIYWLMEARGIGFALHPKAMVLIERQARRHLAHQIGDPDLRARLTPHYQIGCKRILFSNDFYPALTRDNVNLVTTGIDHIEEHAIVDADGSRREVDTIIFGTGFDVGAGLLHTPITGTNGRTLAEEWKRDGLAAHLGINVAGFPNLFLLLGPNTGLGHNSVLFMVESQIHYVLSALALLDARDCDVFEVRREAQDAWVANVRSTSQRRVWHSGCVSWYLDEEGRNVSIWPKFSWQYWLATRRVRRSTVATRIARVAS